MGDSLSKLLIQKCIKKGEKVITLSKKGVPIAIAMEDFKVGDVGNICFDVIYPVKYRYKLIFLPGLEKVSTKIKKVKRKYRRNINDRRRTTSKKNKRSN